MENSPIRKRAVSHPEGLKFSILIPSWNNLNYLQLCIESLRKNSAYSHQIIVHINEGTDGTLDWVNGQTDLDYTYSEKNIGVCYALNAGRELMVTEYVVYINDDMYVCPGWDEALWKEVNQLGHSYFFFSSTAIEPQASSNCVIEKNFGTDISSFRENLLLQQFTSLEKQDWQGSTWPPNIVHRDLWDLVGGYSIEFSPGLYSDPDFSMKLWLAGVRIFKGVSKSRVYHFGSRSTRRVSRNKGYYTFISKWGITSRTFTHHYLKRGELFQGELKEPERSFFLMVKGYFKRIVSLFKTPYFPG
ncbi:MAG: glycosyltransferase family 2 protein [Chitinophagaceae bacterium]